MNYQETNVVIGKWKRYLTGQSINMTVTQTENIEPINYVYQSKKLVQ